MRTRDEQVESACQQIVQSSGWANLEGWVRGHIQEAEDRAVAAERERNDALIRDLRKELNERRYGRSAAK